MPRPQDVLAEISAITTRLISLGLSDSQRHPAMRMVGGGITVIDVGADLLPAAGFGRKPYREIYAEIADSRSYNARLLDGGLLLLQYTFRGDKAIKHRLAFWASPTLEAFQTEPELYAEDELYLDFLDPSIVPFPIRFDFGLDEAANEPIVHPRSHLTLGQYQNCRIPVSSPLSPSVFVDFVLRNFYSSAYKRFATVAAGAPAQFDASLYDQELAVPHLVLRAGPSGIASTLRALLPRQGGKARR